MHSCWVEINLSALRHNFRAVQSLVGEDIGVIAVVKANAYGHGAVEVGRLFAEMGATMLAVTRLDEGLALRAAGLEAPILLLAPPLQAQCDEVIQHDLTACISDLQGAQNLSHAATRQNRTASVQLKINTGMGRLGVEPESAIETAKQIQALPNLKLTGAYTHFASASERDTGLVLAQYGRFQPLVQQISRATGLNPKDFHCANSAALLRFPSMRLSCVRPGTILYGQFPSPMAGEAAQDQGLKLREGFEVKARIIAIKNLRRGQTLGYGPEWKATRPSRIATLAVGYADGLTMEPHARTASYAEVKRAAQVAAKRAAQWYGVRADDASRKVRLNGQNATIIGRIAMQQCSIDITHLPDAQTGDIATVWMRRLSAGAHLPRVYVED